MMADVTGEATTGVVAPQEAASEESEAEFVPLALRKPGKKYPELKELAQPAKSEAAPPALKEAESNPTESDNKPETTKAEKKAYRVKYKDKEFVLDDDEKIQRLLQRSYGADQRFEEAARKEAESEKVLRFLEELKEDPRLIRHIIGEERARQFSVEDATEQMLAAQDAAKLTPNERRLKAELDARNQELSRYQQQTLRQQQEHAEAQRKAEIEEAREAIGSTAVHVLEALKLPDTLKPVIARKMVPYLQANLLRDEPLSPQAIAADYMDDTKTEFASIAQEMEGDQLVSWLGDAVAKKILNWSLAKVKGGTSEMSRTAHKPPAAYSVPKQKRGMDPIDAIVRAGMGFEDES